MESEYHPHNLRGLMEALPLSKLTPLEVIRGYELLGDADRAVIQDIYDIQKKPDFGKLPPMEKLELDEMKECALVRLTDKILGSEEIDAPAIN